MTHIYLILILKNVIMKIKKKSIKHFKDYNLKSPQTIVGGTHCEFTSDDVIACDDGSFWLFDEDQDGNTVVYHLHSDGTIH